MEVGGAISSPDIQTQKELSSQLVNKTVADVQKHLSTPFQLDELFITYSEQPSEQRWSESGCRTKDKVKWGSIKFGKEIPNKEDFLDNKLGLEESARIGHEYTHLVTREFDATDRYSSTFDILQEGVAVGVEMKIRNSKSLYDVVDPREVVSHCGRIINEKKEILLNESVTRDLEMSKTMAYDGFALNRPLIHIAGIFFVGSVLGPRVDLAEILYKNPPTYEEIVDPNKYKERVKIDLNQPVKDILPITPKINPN